MTTSPMPVSTQCVTTVQGVMSYRETGPKEAPCIVLLHGIGSSSAAWSEQFGPLGTQHRVIAWDAPGYARSTQLGQSQPEARDYAEALGRLLDAIQISEACLVASSWGSLVALAYAAAQPQRVRSLVLAGPTAGYVHMPEDERRQAMASRTERIRRLGPGAMAAADARRLVAPAASDELVTRLATAGAELTIGGYLQALHMLFHSDGVAMISALPHPVLMVAGYDDVVAPPDKHAKRLVAAANNAVLEMVPHCGHLPHAEIPARFNAAVLSHATR
jgi:pimeloyl-ACP methyl ester carboxylesterase